MLKNIVLLILIVISIASCSENFKTGAPYKNVDIIYGLLNSVDTAQYIKITRGFFDEDANNLTVATNPDSLYHPSLEVKLEQIQNNNVVKTIALNRVDLTLEGFPKQPGTFATTPNYAYKTKENIIGEAFYRLVVTNPKSGSKLTSTTQVLSGALNFTNLSPGSPIGITDPTKKTSFIWSVPPNTGMSEVWMRINYWEEEGSVATFKSFDAPIATRVLQVGTGNNNVQFANNAFAGLFRLGMEPATPSVKRFIDTCGLVLYAGGKELANYIGSTSAQGGLTADQIKPIYTNIKSDNKDKNDVYGLFDTRTSKVFNNVPLSKSTIDSLVANPSLQDLNIVGPSNR